MLSIEKDYNITTACPTQNGSELMFFVMQSAFLNIKNNDEYKHVIKRIKKEYTNEIILKMAEGNKEDADYLKYALLSAIHLFNAEEKLGMLNDAPSQKHIDKLKKITQEELTRKMDTQFSEISVKLFEKMQEYIKNHDGLTNIQSLNSVSKLAGIRGYFKTYKTTEIESERIKANLITLFQQNLLDTDFSVGKAKEKNDGTLEIKITFNGDKGFKDFADRVTLQDIRNAIGHNAKVRPPTLIGPYFYIVVPPAPSLTNDYRLY